ncbi:heat shock 70 kDa protein 15-like [Castanea sativa]|uniref:heat shock 70 kDa protein 15-like n=1 Tax=Castanea sativa TaxID=21020 RepID=UPI003F653121
MALQDRIMEETKDRKNAVEAYVYDMRNKLSDKYQEFVTDSEREGFTTKLQEGAIIDQLVRCINSYRVAAVSNYHIDISEKEKVLNECVEAEAWLREKRLQRDSIPKYVNPVLSSADVLKKTETLERFYKLITMKPRAARAKPATPEAPPTPPPQASEQQQPRGVDANASRGGSKWQC